MSQEKKPMTIRLLHNAEFMLCRWIVHFGNEPYLLQDLRVFSRVVQLVENGAYPPFQVGRYDAGESLITCVAVIFWGRHGGSEFADFCDFLQLCVSQD